MLPAVNSHDGREQRLDPRQRFSQAVVVRLNDVGAQLGDARATPVCRLEAFTLDACGVERLEHRAYGVDLESALSACFGERLASAAAVVEPQPFEQRRARGSFGDELTEGAGRIDRTHLITSRTLIGLRAAVVRSERQGSGPDRGRLVTGSWSARSLANSCLSLRPAWCPAGGLRVRGESFAGAGGARRAAFLSGRGGWGKGGPGVFLPRFRRS